MSFSSNAHISDTDNAIPCVCVCEGAGERGERGGEPGTELCMGMVMTICPKIHFLINAGFVWLHHERQLCIYWKQVTVIVWCPGKTRPSPNPLKGVKLILRLEYPFRKFSLFILMVWASLIPCALDVDRLPPPPPPSPFETSIFLGFLGCSLNGVPFSSDALNDTLKNVCLRILFSYFSTPFFFFSSRADSLPIWIIPKSQFQTLPCLLSSGPSFLIARMSCF